MEHWRLQADTWFIMMRACLSLPLYVRQRGIGKGKNRKTKNNKATMQLYNILGVITESFPYFPPPSHLGHGC